MYYKSNLLLFMLLRSIDMLINLKQISARSVYSLTGPNYRPKVHTVKKTLYTTVTVLKFSKNEKNGF